MKFIYLHEEDGATFLVNTAYIVAIFRGTEEGHTVVFVDSPDEDLKELWVMELPGEIHKMIKE